MNKKDKGQEEELLKSLASEIGMSETEIKALIEKAEEMEEKEDKKEDEEEEEKTEKSEEQEIMKSIKSEFEKLKTLNTNKEQTKEEDLNKSEDNDILKSLQEGLSSLKDDLQKSMEDSLSAMVSEKIEKSLSGFGEKMEEISKSLDLIGESSQGTKGMRFSNYLQKSGDTSPVEKDGKTYISSSDRKGISDAMVSLIEKSEDEGMKQSVTADLINYQSTGTLTDYAVKRLNKSGIMFKEQMND